MPNLTCIEILQISNLPFGEIIWFIMLQNLWYVNINISTFRTFFYVPNMHAIFNQLIPFNYMDMTKIRLLHMNIDLRMSIYFKSITLIFWLLAYVFVQHPAGT